MKQWFFLFSFLMAVSSAHAFNPDFHDLDEDGVKTILKAGKEVQGGANYEEPVILDYFWRKFSRYPYLFDTLLSIRHSRLSGRSIQSLS